MTVSDDIIKKSLFIRDYIDQQIEVYKLQYPQAREKDLRAIITNIVKRRIKDVPASIYNDYQDDRVISSSLLGIYDWYKTKKPIMAGNGTFFFDQDKASSPIADIIIGKIAKRKEARDTRDEFVKTPDCYEYGYFDMIQAEIKITINAIYGSFGTPTFQLYNIFTAGATTGTAQSLISTTAAAFESYTQNNVRFKNTSEFYRFVDNVIKEEHSIPIGIFTMHTDEDDVFIKVKDTFREYYKPEYKDSIMRVIRNLDGEQRTRLYYKNNLIEFTKNKVIDDLLVKIFNLSPVYTDANKPPEEIQGLLNDLWVYYKEMVFYNHPYVERIKRLKTDTRKEVILEDTDSNVLTILDWTRYIEENVQPKSICTLNAENKKYLSVNIFAYQITELLKDLLSDYCDRCNILPRMKGRINMKNELYFPKILLSKVKKRYITLIKLREGNIINPPKPDIKGHDFKKAGTSPSTEEALKDIIKKCILVPEIDPVDVTRMNSMLFKLENEIIKSLKNGERTYLPRVKCKPDTAYAEKDRWSKDAVLGPLLWNVLYPENPLMLPDKLDMVHLIIPNLESLEPLKKTYPKIYEKFDKYIFNGPIPRFKEKGVVYLALPNGPSPIPEWALPYININKLVSKNINTFKPVTEALRFHTIKASNDTEFFSNIIDI